MSKTAAVVLQRIFENINYIVQLNDIVFAVYEMIMIIIISGLRDYSRRLCVRRLPVISMVKNSFVLEKTAKNVHPLLLHFEVGVFFFLYKII